MWEATGKKKQGKTVSNQDIKCQKEAENGRKCCNFGTREFSTQRGNQLKRGTITLLFLAVSLFHIFDPAASHFNRMRHMS